MQKNNQEKSSKSNAKRTALKYPQNDSTKQHVGKGKQTQTTTSKTKQNKTNTNNRVKSAPKNSKNTIEHRSPSQVNKARQVAKKGANNRGVKRSPLKIIPLGGLGEIGKNLTVYEYENDIIIVDCGMSFPNADMLGVDIVIPDFTYLKNNSSKIRGLIVTHGHEDHIGGIPFLLKELNIPIYATALTLGLIKCKLTEHNLINGAKLHTIKDGSSFKLGKFSIEAIHVNHSIPDAVAFAITTPAGIIVQTGDFKIDTTPINGEPIDLARFSDLGKQGVLALLMDSTNATRPGVTMSERTVGESLSHLFAQAGKKRIIVATFSSNIHRIQQIIDEAKKVKRKVCIMGRSMENVVNVATELGYLNIPKGILVDMDMLNNYTDSQLVIVTTGAQGEPMSALHRMAFGDHRKVKIGDNDLIIVSATPIPGNEKTVTIVINELMKLGAKVIYEKMYDVHVSGHACQEELKLIMSLVKPKYFIPVHGEQMHLVKQVELGTAMGIDREDILVAQIGQVIEISPNRMKVTGEVPSGFVLVDGIGVGDVGSVVLRDRKVLSEEGIIVVAVTIDEITGEILSGPELISRGFVYVKENEQMMKEARDKVIRAIKNNTKNGYLDWPSIKTSIKDTLSSYLFEQTHRNPVVMPIVLQL